MVLRICARLITLAESILWTSSLVGTIWNSEPEWERVIRLGKLASCTQQLRQCRPSHRSSRELLHLQPEDPA